MLDACHGRQDAAGSKVQDQQDPHPPILRQDPGPEAGMSAEELERASGSDAGQEAEDDDAGGATSAEQSDGGSDEDDDGDGDGDEDDDDGDEDDDDGDGEDDEESDQPAPRRKRFRIEDLPQREMPNRATRANRYNRGEVVADEEEGDADFWCGWGCVPPRMVLSLGFVVGARGGGVAWPKQVPARGQLSSGRVEKEPASPPVCRLQEPGFFR